MQSSTPSKPIFFALGMHIEMSSWKIQAAFEDFVKEIVTLDFIKRCHPYVILKKQPKGVKKIFI
jgi:hypothetical protein